jgi:hypothetical protein
MKPDKSSLLIKLQRAQYSEVTVPPVITALALATYIIIFYTTVSVRPVSTATSPPNRVHRLWTDSGPAAHAVAQTAQLHMHGGHQRFYATRRFMSRWSSRPWMMPGAMLLIPRLEPWSRDICSNCLAVRFPERQILRALRSYPLGLTALNQP